MHRSHQRRALGAIAVAATLLLAACGASGGSEAADDDETTTTEAEATTTEADETTTTEAEEPDEPEDEPADAEAQARAESIDLTEDDFGGEWTANTPPDDDDESSPADDCDPSFTDDSDEVAEFEDDYFYNGDPENQDGTVFISETKVFVDEDAASAAIAPFADEEVLACIDAALKEQFSGGGANTVEGEFTGEDYGETEVDEAVSASAEYTVTTEDGTEVPVVVAVALLRSGDLATQILVQSFGDSLDFEELGTAVVRIEELHAAL